MHRFGEIFGHALAIVIEKTKSILGICITCFRLGLNFLNLFAISFDLLSGQLKERGTQQQQKREHQLIHFHIGRLVGSQWESASPRTDSLCASGGFGKPAGIGASLPFTPDRAHFARLPCE